MPTIKFVGQGIQRLQSPNSTHRQAFASVTLSLTPLHWYTGWLKIEYLTGEYAISPQPVVWFLKFLKLLNPESNGVQCIHDTLRQRHQTERQAMEYDYKPAGTGTVIRRRCIVVPLASHSTHGVLTIRRVPKQRRQVDLITNGPVLIVSYKTHPHSSIMQRLLQHSQVATANWI